MEDQFAVTLTPDARSTRPRAHTAARTAPIEFERLALDDCDWARMDAMPDRVLFQTRAWLEFVARTQDAEPVVARLRREGEAIGFFTGLIVRRYGITILGSPFPGWTTTSMGFNLVDGVDRWAATEALIRFAFRDLGCLHLELKDRYLTLPAPSHLRLASSPQQTFEVDLAADEEVIF